MRKKVLRCILAALCASMFTALPVSANIPASADEGSDQEEAVFEVKQEDYTVVSKTAANPIPTDGNGNLIGDAKSSDDKRFYTITAKNGNVFYMIIDGQRESDNVYMTSLVAEDEIMAFVEEYGGSTSSKSEETAYSESTLFGNASASSVTPEPVTTPAPVQTKKGPNAAGIALLLLGLGLLGGMFFLKSKGGLAGLRKKDDEYDEFEDDEDYEDEDSDDDDDNDGGGDDDDPTGGQPINETPVYAEPPSNASSDREEAEALAKSLPEKRGEEERPMPRSFRRRTEEVPPPVLVPPAEASTKEQPEEKPSAETPLVRQEITREETEPARAVRSSEGPVIPQREDLQERRAFLAERRERRGNQVADSQNLVTLDFSKFEDEDLKLLLMALLKKLGEDEPAKKAPEAPIPELSKDAGPAISLNEPEMKEETPVVLPSAEPERDNKPETVTLSNVLNEEKPEPLIRSVENTQYNEIPERLRAAQESPAEEEAAYGQFGQKSEEPVLEDAEPIIQRASLFDNPVRLDNVSLPGPDESPAAEDTPPEESVPPDEAKEEATVEAESLPAEEPEGMDSPSAPIPDDANVRLQLILENVPGAREALQDGSGHDSAVALKNALVEYFRAAEEDAFRKPIPHKLE